MSEQSKHRDIQAAIWRLKNANTTALLHIVTHDPDMIKDVVYHLCNENESLNNKLEKFENLQFAILEFLKVE